MLYNDTYILFLLHTLSAYLNKKKTYIHTYTTQQTYYHTTQAAHMTKQVIGLVFFLLFANFVVVVVVDFT